MTVKQYLAAEELSNAAKAKPAAPPNPASLEPERRKFWAAVFLEASRQSGIVIDYFPDSQSGPRLSVVDSADRALAAFDRRFGTLPDESPNPEVEA